MNESASSVARQALDLAKDVERRVDSHEDICALRYAQLEASVSAVKTEVASSVGDIKKILGWAGAAGFTILIGLLGFFLKAQYDSNQKLADRIESLQQQQSVYEQSK